MQRKNYLTPVTNSTGCLLENHFLYSGLKDMTDNPVYPIEDLDDDN